MTGLVKSSKQSLHFQQEPNKDPDPLTVAVIRFYWSSNSQYWAALFLFWGEMRKVMPLRCPGVLVRTVSPGRNICFLSGPLSWNSDSGIFFMLKMVFWALRRGWGWGATCKETRPLLLRLPQSGMSQSLYEISSQTYSRRTEQWDSGWLPSTFSQTDFLDPSLTIY